MEIRDVSKLRIHPSSPCSTDWGGKKDFHKKKKKNPDVPVLSRVRVTTRRSDEIHA